MSWSSLLKRLIRGADRLGPKLLERGPVGLCLALYTAVFALWVLIPLPTTLLIVAACLIFGDEKSAT